MEKKKELVEKNGVSSHALGSPQKIGMLDGFESHGARGTFTCLTGKVRDRNVLFTLWFWHLTA